MLSFFRTPHNAWVRAAWLMLTVLITVSAVQALRPANEVRGDITSEPPREQFKAGGERSEVVLREILAVLKKMDARLEHIEKAASDSTKAGRPATKSSTSSRKESNTP